MYKDNNILHVSNLKEKRDFNCLRSVLTLNETHTKSMLDNNMQFESRIEENEHEKEKKKNVLTVLRK